MPYICCMTNLDSFHARLDRQHCATAHVDSTIATSTARGALEASKFEAKLPSHYFKEKLRGRLQTRALLFLSYELVKKTY